MTAMFKVAITEGWIDIMFYAVDSSFEKETVEDNQPLWCVYFCSFSLLYLIYYSK